MAKRSIIKNAKKMTFKFSAKQMVIAAVFALSLMSAIGLGLHAKQQADAASTRDCSTNSIDRENRNGGCGALSRGEFIEDVKDNRPSDLKAIYAHTGLSSSEYDDFRKNARHGVLKRNGDIVVDGQVVMKDAWTMGREKFNGQRKSLKINGKTYYHSHPSDSFASGVKQLDVMVLFNSKGVVDFAVLEACGNPITKGRKEKPSVDCDMLNKKEVGLNKYEFTTKVSSNKLAKVVEVEYFLDGKKIGQSSNAGSNYKITHTFTGSGTVTAKVRAKVPGGKIVTVSSSKCKEKVDFKQPFYECKNLKAAVKNEDEDHTTYNLTVMTNQGDGATFKSVDYIVNGETVAENAGKEHEVKLENGKTHEIVAKAMFSIGGKTVADECKTTVSPDKPFYACDVLRPEAINEEKTQFRFTVVASFGNGAELEDADFATWKVGDEGNKTVVEGITQKDEEGNIYHEFEFEADGVERIVEATVNFGVLGSAKSVTCQANVIPEEAPKCPIPGKENLPPESPECKEDEKPEEPKEEVLGKELPKTGAASVFGIFASATGAGAAAHRLITRRLGR